MVRYFTGDRCVTMIGALALLFLAPFGILVHAQTNDLMDKLRKIKILESSRDDVEKNLQVFQIVRHSNLAETEKNGWGEVIEYETKDGSIEAKYSTGKCSESYRNYAYNVPKGIVVQLIFLPDVPLTKGRLWFDLDNFAVEKVDDVNDSYVYTNKETGVQVGTLQGRIDRLEFGLSDEQLKLRCS